MKNSQSPMLFRKRDYEATPLWSPVAGENFLLFRVSFQMEHVRKFVPLFGNT